MNTTTGPKEYDRSRPGHVVTTSHAVEEDLQYQDEEPGVFAVLCGDGWSALVEGEAIPLVALVVLDDGVVYGVPVQESGFINLKENVETYRGFTGYVQTNNVTKE